MTRTFRCTAATMLVSLVVLLYGCSSTRPVENLEDVSIPAGLTMEQIENALVQGGQTRGWLVKKLEPGHAEATIFVRSHVAKVDIYYNQDSYSIRYKDSENLDHADGKIHGRYNEWVANLSGDIQRAMVYLPE